MIRVLVVDDHEVVRTGIVHHLERTGDIEVVAQAAGVTAAAALDDVQVDVAVLDVRLPDGSGTDLCRTLIDKGVAATCVMHTSYADPASLADALDAGARGYVLKTMDTDRLVDAIRQAHAGEVHIDEEAQAALDRWEAGDSGDDQIDRLSPQERKVLELISRGLTNREIADEMALAEKTVKNYVSNMLHKLGMKRRSEAAALAARLHR